MTRTALFLFAPKFLQLGLDVAHAFCERHGVTRIDGLCTGPATLVEEVRKGLRDRVGTLHHLPSEEVTWFNTPLDADALRGLKDLEARYPSGTAGDTIVADRRLGAGFLFDGLTRPDPFGDRARAEAARLPSAWLLGLYSFLEELVDRLNPDLVFCYAVAGGPAFALGRVAEARQIPFVQLIPTRIGSRYMMDDTLLTLLGPAKDRFERGGPELEAHLPEARSYLEAFRARPEMPEYQQRFDALQAKRQLMPDILKRVRKAASLYLRSIGPHGVERRLRARRKFAEASALWNERNLDMSVFKQLEDVPGPFAYLPLQVAPESSTMVMSPAHTNQISVVEAMAKSLPAHMTLVVKEHSPMMGMRPKGYYKKIAEIPRVALLSPAWRGLDICQQADLTAVITGTAAWEALCLGRPTLVIGDASFLWLGHGAVHAPDLSSLRRKIPEALNCPPMPDEILERLIAAMQAESFDFPASLLWDTYEDHPEAQRRTVTTEMADHLARRMEPLA